MYIKYANIAISYLVYINEFISINKMDREPENSGYGEMGMDWKWKKKLNWKIKIIINKIKINKKNVPTWGKIKAPSARSGFNYLSSHKTITQFYK